MIEPVIRPMGFDWKIGTALIGTFAAKEVFISQMGIVYSLGRVEEDDTKKLAESLKENYSPLTAFCLMLFLLIAAPCMATFAITRQEAGKIKWACLQFFGLTAIGYIITVLVYQIGSLIG